MNMIKDNNIGSMGLITRLNELMENEACSCSMDFGCITPEYVYRMWGGTVSLNEIEQAIKDYIPAGR